MNTKYQPCACLDSNPFHLNQCPNKVLEQQRTAVIYPYCNICGWRKGGVDSWNGRACKCGHRAAPIVMVAP